jgi:type IV secretory pathway VirB10-like protein
MGKQLRELVDPPRSRAPQMRIPEAVEEIVMRALSKRRELRYATAQEMRDALLATVATEEKPRSRTRRVAGIVVGAAALLAAFGLTARFVATKDAEVAFADDALAASSAVAPAMGDGDKTDEMPPEPAMAAKTAETVAAAPSPAASAPSPGPSFARDLAEGRGMTKLERVRALADARNRARAHLSDPALLKAWAWAAYRAGDLREAKRAAQMWGLHDASVGPKLLYATALEASGHRNLAKSMLEQWVAQHPADAEEAKELLARLAVPAGKGRLARK